MVWELERDCEVSAKSCQTVESCRGRGSRTTPDWLRRRDWSIPTDAAVYPIDFEPERVLRQSPHHELARRAATGARLLECSLDIAVPGRSRDSCCCTSEDRANAPDAAPQATNTGATWVDHVLFVDEGETFWVAIWRRGRRPRVSRCRRLEANRSLFEVVARASTRGAPRVYGSQ